MLYKVQKPVEIASIETQCVVLLQQYQTTDDKPMACQSMALFLQMCHPKQLVSLVSHSVQPFEATAARRHSISRYAFDSEDPAHL